MGAPLYILQEPVLYINPTGSGPVFSFNAYMNICVIGWWSDFRSSITALSERLKFLVVWWDREAKWILIVRDCCELFYPIVSFFISFPDVYILSHLGETVRHWTELEANSTAWRNRDSFGKDVREHTFCFLIDTTFNILLWGSK